MVLSRKIELSDEVLTAIAEDAKDTALPRPLEAAVRWLTLFTRNSWEVRDSDRSTARSEGLEDRDLVDLVQMGAFQTFAINQADGGGAAFFDEGGPTVGHRRDWYHEHESDRTGQPISAGGQPKEMRSVASSESTEAVCAVSTDLESAVYREAAAHAEKRWGFIPNLLKAVSGGRGPQMLPMQQLSLELLEGPQSNRLSSRAHALVRAQVSALNRSRYFESTIRKLLERAGWPIDTYDKFVEGQSVAMDADEERACLLARKATLNAYKIVESDVEAFRASPLGEPGYLDVLGTVGLQLGVERTTNCLGVVSDERPILASSG